MQLLVSGLLERSATVYAARTCVARRADGTIERRSYADIHLQARKLASALSALGVGRGDRVATFAWNNNRHMEAYIGVPSMGAVCHTINLRLDPSQIVWIAGHAGDSVVLLDECLVDDWLRASPDVPTVVVMGDDTAEARDRVSAHGYATHDYDDLLSAVDPVAEWPELDENDAAFMCYTSGTTGDPKGVVYSHRAMYLHTLVHGLTDIHGISESDTVMPVVPMFHANAWGIPLAALMVGARVVLPGPSPKPTDVVDLIRSEKVTYAAGVPTVFHGVLDCATREDLSCLRRIALGGSAVPGWMIDAYLERFGVPVQQGYGMTETGPLAVRSHVKSDASQDDVRSQAQRQGLPVPGVELKLVDADGNAVSHDGQSVGEICMRGLWIATAYYREDAPDTFRDGWLHTADLGTIDAEGFVTVVDRVKDLVKSGGEWISSVELENRIMGHPDVLEAAVVAAPDAKWGERPVAFVAARPGVVVVAADVVAHLKGQVPNWWLPDRIEIVESIPKTGVGKFDKRAMRALLDD